jgi:Spy/CpxP family protein refolding chaperone
MLLMSRTIAFTVALGLVASTTASWAEPPKPPPASAATPESAGQVGKPPARPTPPASAGSLTPAQHEQLAKLRAQTNERLAPQRQRLQAKRLELRKLWLAEPPSQQAILKALTEMDAIRAPMRPIQVESRLAHLALLTREQRQFLGQTEPRHECAECQGQMGQGHGHHCHGTHAAGSAQPPMGCGGDVGLDGDCSLDLGPMECPMQPPSAPAAAKPMGH